MKKESLENTQKWINKLSLSRHPEGGYFKEVYRSEGHCYYRDKRREGAEKKRHLCTSIYYLLGPGEFSAFHILESDETWHYYSGNTALLIHCITEEGRLYSLRLCNEYPDAPQIIIPENTWFAVVPEHIEGYALCGCTVSPGFDTEDFRLASCNYLSERYAQLNDLFKKYCILD